MLKLYHKTQPALSLMVCLDFVQTNHKLPRVYSNNITVR